MIPSLRVCFYRVAGKGFLKPLILVSILVLFSKICFAQVDITRWDFETGSPLAGGNTTPSPTTGTGTAQKVGSMSGETVATGTTNSCTGSNTTGTQAWQFGTANPGTLESSGVEFKSSTVGYENIQFTWDQRSSNASTRTVRVQYTTDGTTWINFTLTSSNFISGCSNRSALDNGKIDVGNPITSNAGDAWSRRTVDFSSITAANDNPNFGVRLLASHYDATNQFRQAQAFGSTVNTSTPGTWRFDNVAFRGTAIIVNPTQPFTSCNLTVYRVGDGSLTLNTSAVPVSVLEVSSSNGSIIQTLSTPFLTSNLLTQSGSASSNGNLNSYNNLLAVPGHNSAIGTVDVNQQNTKVTNIIDPSVAVVNRVVHPSSTFDSDNYRAAIPLTSTTFYASGNGNSSTKGVFYFDGTNFNQLVNFNTRNIEIFNGQLFYSTASANSGNIGIYALGTGLPTSSVAATPFITYPATNGSGPYGFSISPDGCTAYIADDGSTNYPGVSKWTKDSGGNWTFQYNNPTQARGLVVDYSGINPVLYATTTETNDNKIIKITDTGSLSTVTNLLNSGNNYLFRGIDFTPNSSAPISITQQPQNQTTCQGTAVSLSVTASSAASLTYQWYSNSINSLCGATPISGATNSTYSPSVSSPGTTYYFVKIVSSCLSVSYSNIVSVNVTAPTVPTFSAIGNQCPGNNFSLSNNSTNGIVGTWSPAINPFQTTSYTFTPNSGQCATTGNLTVTIYSTSVITAVSP
ncbi:MAG: hypothetical protein RL264_1888 [Bacteroidota bacterium]|jgi:hypothetical protein